MTQALNPLANYRMTQAEERAAATRRSLQWGHYFFMLTYVDPGMA